MNRLKNKVAVVYGNGGVGTAIATAFANEGAMVYLAGRTSKKIKTIADAIVVAGGKIETVILDTLDETAVENHMDEIIRKSGRIDITFNAIGLPQTSTQGTALTELSTEQYILPITTYNQSHFITAKAAAKRMVQQKSGVIMMHIPNPSRISQPFIGGMPSTWAGIEALCRSISVEYGSLGVRSVCLLTTAIPETPLIDEVFEIHGKAHNTDYDQFRAVMESMTHRKRLTSLEELTNTAVFAASDEGSAITGTAINLTAGMIVN